MNYDMITFGIPMVEILRKEPDVPLSGEGEFIGPFAAGDPGIALNACAVLGNKTAYIGVVGNDVLAECFFAQMRRSGIDTSRVRTDPVHTTGMSLCANFSDGTRSFVFTLPTSAAAQICVEDIDNELIREVKWIHVSGFALSVADSFVELHRELMRRIGDDVLVSFDPNFRRDIIAEEPYKRACAEVFARCNLFLPSVGEAVLFADAPTDEEACRQIAATGKRVALKRGARGCTGFADGAEYATPAFPAEEVDPTGAGDTFGGALIAALIDGQAFPDALRYAAAAGSIAVGRVGLMNAAPTDADINAIL